MATVDKNFRIKHGLVIEGDVATLNGNNILSQNTQAGDSYILNLVGGATLVKSVDTGVFNVDNAGNLTVNANTFDSYGSASAAQTAAASDATTKANTAKSEAVASAASDATTKADTAKSEAISAAAADATTKANAAQSAAISTAALDATSKANAAQSAAATDATNKADAAQTAAESFATNKANDAYANAVSAAAADATSKANAAKTAAEATAAMALTAAIATEVTNRNTAISTAVDGLVDGAPNLLNTLNELAAAINDDANYTTTITTALATKANGADVASSLAGKQDNLTAGSNIDITNNVVSVTGLPTSADIAQDIDGDYLYTSNGTLNVDSEGIYDAFVQGGMATTTNISNAVNELVDGTTAFTEINVNDEAKHIAATSSSLGSVVVTAYEWPKADYRSGKFLVKIDNGTHNEISEILVTLDSADQVAITEYAIVGTNGSRGSITASVSGANVQLRVDPVNDSTIKVTGTLLK